MYNTKCAHKVSFVCLLWQEDQLVSLQKGDYNRKKGKNGYTLAKDTESIPRERSTPVKSKKKKDGKFEEVKFCTRQKYKAQTPSTVC